MPFFPTIEVAHITHLDLGRFQNYHMMSHGKWFEITNHPFLTACFRSKDLFALSYCWWKNSCSTWDVKILVNNGINYQPQLVLAGFLNHRQYQHNLAHRLGDRLIPLASPFEWVSWDLTNVGPTILVPTLSRVFPSRVARIKPYKQHVCLSGKGPSRVTSLESAESSCMVTSRIFRISFCQAIATFWIFFWLHSKLIWHLRYGWTSMVCNGIWSIWYLMVNTQISFWLFSWYMWR